jgi:hypothetical protein
MKKISLGILTGLSLTLLIAFSTATQEIKNSTAEVKQVQGLYIFTDCKPVKEVDYLGTVKVKGVVMSNKYTAMRDLLIKKAKKDFPKADGIIISDDSFEADAIKFK